jgi:hypothetical protein
MCYQFDLKRANGKCSRPILKAPSQYSSCVLAFGHSKAIALCQPIGMYGSSQALDLKIDGPDLASMRRSLQDHGRKQECPDGTSIPRGERRFCWRNRNCSSKSVSVKIIIRGRRFASGRIITKSRLTCFLRISRC